MVTLHNDMEQAPRKTSFLQAAPVFWSFFGVRKRTDYDSDAVKLTLGQVIAASLIGAALFVGVLLGWCIWSPTLPPNKNFEATKFKLKLTIRP